MIRYCGQCGTTLTAAALQAGRCPQCGAAIEYSGDTLAPDAAPPGDMPTHLMDRASAAVPATDAAATRISSADATSARQPVERGWPYVADSQGAPQVGTLMTQLQATRRTRWALALFLAVPLVLAGTSVLMLTQTGIFAFLAPSSATHGGAMSGATASASAGGATSTAAGVSHARTQTPVPGATASVTASPSPTASASPQGSPVAGPAYLSVYPTTINIPICVAANASFTVANTGGTTMQWRASSSPDTYIITPGSGTIAAGRKQTVNVSQISSRGTITITAPNAGNSPQQVTITCNLL